MKNLIQFLLRSILVLGVAVLMFRCNKDDDDDKTTAELIIGTWQVTADVISPPFDFGSGPISDVYALYEACEKDNVVVIKENGVGEYNEGATKCDAADPQTEAFTWALSNNDKNLTVTQAPFGFTFEIVQLDNSTLKLVLKETIGGTEYTETTTYTRK